MVYILLHWIIALVWFVNGFYCKVLNGVPRHRQIVERILKLQNAAKLTVFIGILELCMFCWIVAGWWHYFNVWVQVIIIAAMNITEYFFAKDLLLWRGWNAFFAFLLIVFVLFVELVLY